MATSGTPSILVNGTSVYRVNPGDVITGAQGDYVDTDGMVPGSVRVQFWWGQANLLKNGAFGNEGTTDTYTITEADVGRHLYITYQYTRDDGSSTIVQPFSGSIAVEPATPALQRPRFNRRQQQGITDAGPQGKVFNFTDHGNHLYAAANVDGCYVWDISDPANPVYVRKIQLLDGGVPSDIPITDCKVYPVNGVDHLFLCGRRIDFTINNETGIFACYSLSDPSNPTWESSYRPPDMSPKPQFQPGFYGNNWYQGMSYNPDQPNVVNVASQLDGHTAMDVSTPSAVTPIGVFGFDELAPFIVSNPNWEEWEASNCSSFTDINGRLWALYPNHGRGVYLIDVTTPSAPGNPIWLRGFQPFRLNGTDVNQSRIQVRHRMSHMVGYQALICFNTAGGTGSDDRPARGLVSIDLSDPTTMPADAAATDAWTWSPIGIEDNDTWNGEGDQPQLAFTVDPNELYAYVANGREGTAVFDIRIRASPRYLGMEGTNLDAQTNLYQSYAVERGGKRYQYYSDAYDAAPQRNYLYVDEVTNMPGTIGYYTTSDTADQVTNDDAYTSDMALSYTAVPGDFVSLVGYYGSSGAARTPLFNIYTVSGGEPVNKITTDITVNGVAALGNHEQVVNIPLTPGTEYMVAFCGNNGGSTINLASNENAASARRRSGTNQLPDPWTALPAAANPAGLSVYAIVSNSGGGGGGLPPDSYVQLSTLQDSKADIVLGTGAPTLPAFGGHIALRAGANINTGLTQSIVGTFRVLRRYLLNNLNSIDATTELHVPFGGSNGAVRVGGAHTADDCTLYIEAVAAVQEKSGYINRTYTLLEEYWLEQSK